MNNQPNYTLNHHHHCRGTHLKQLLQNCTLRKNVLPQQYEQAMAKLLMFAKKQNNKLFDITFSFADPSCIIAICRRHPYFWEPTTSTPITDSIFIDLIVNIRVFQVQEFRCSLAVHSIFDAIISIRTLGFSYIALFVQWVFCWGKLNWIVTTLDVISNEWNK